MTRVKNKAGKAGPNRPSGSTQSPKTTALRGKMESVFTMTGALLIAFVIKAYAMDVYVIPTSAAGNAAVAIRE